MGKKGQSLVEFVVIIAVVVLGGILVLTLLGDNINTLFFKSEQKVASFQPFGDPSTSPSTTTSTTPSTTTSSTTTPSTTTTSTTTPSTATTSVNGVDVNINPDGSVSFNYSGQDILLSSTMMDNLNIVSESTGSDGITVEVMSAIQKLIDDHKAEYAPADVPVELTFGTGLRNEDIGSFSGTATYNQVKASVGGHNIFVQKDQQTSQSSPLGVHSVEMITTNPSNGGGTATVISSSTPHLIGQNLTFGDFQNGTFDDTSIGSSWSFYPDTSTSAGI